MNRDEYKKIKKGEYAKYNLMKNCKGNGVIGFYKDILKYEKDIVCDYIQRSIDYEDVEKIIVLIRTLENDYDNGVLCEDDMLEVTYIQFCGYGYVKWEMEKE